MFQPFKFALVPSIKKIGILLLLIGFMPVSALAQPTGFFPSGDTQSADFLNGIAKGQCVMPFTNQIAGSLGIEAGERNYRVDGTLGWRLAERERIKFSAEYLRQAIAYAFVEGATRHWVQQGALGFDYQYQLTPGGLNFFDLGGYCAHSPSVYLSPISGSILQDENQIDYTDLRHIAGANAYGMNPGLTLNPWRGAQTTFTVYYDHIVYDTVYATHRTITNGFGSALTLNQQLSHHWQLNVSAATRAPFNTYQAEMVYTLPSGQFSIGLLGNYIQGKEHLPNTSLVGIELNYTFDKSKHVETVNHDGNTPLSTWVQKPAVYLPQVLAIAEEAIITTTTPLDKPVLSVGMIPSAESANGDFNVPTATYFTGDHIIFSATNLASGLSIDPNTGLISGHAITSSMNVVVTGTNARGSVESNAFNLTVPPPCSPPALTSTIPNYYYFFSANLDTKPYFSGSDLVFSATNLPVGLSIDSTTGIISGPSIFGDPNVVVTATNGCGTAQSNAFVIAL